MTAAIDFDPKRRDAIAAKVNLSVLQRADPAVKRVLKLASHVALYQLDDSQSWHRLDIEGSLFVVELHVNHPNNAARARHRIVIINRKSLHNYSDDVVVGNKEIELYQQLIMYTNSKHHTVGIWFYDDAEASSLFQLLQTLVQGRTPSPPPSPPSHPTPSASQPAASAASTAWTAAAAAAPVDAARASTEAPTARARRSQKRVSRNAAAGKNAVKPRQTPNVRASASLDANASRAHSAPNSLERFFPALKHTHGVAGATLPPDVTTSSVMESVAVTTLTADKRDGTEFKPTSEIDEAIVIASDNGLPDSILANASSSADQLVSDAMKLVRSRAEKKPRSDARRKSSPNTKPAPKVTTPLKLQRPKRAHAVSKPAPSDAAPPPPTTTTTSSRSSFPPGSEPFEAAPSVERRRRTSPPPQKRSPPRKPAPKSRVAADVTSADRHAAPPHADKAASEGAQGDSRAARAARQEALASRLEAAASATSSQRAAVKGAAAGVATSEVNAHVAGAGKAPSSGADARQAAGEANVAPAAASVSLPALSVSGAMEEAQRHLQAMGIQQEGVKMGDAVARGMAPFRFAGGGDVQLARTAGLMASPLGAPPQAAAAFGAGIHPQMAMLMQHQLFLQQQQFLAQQEHQRRMQMQSMPMASMGVMHKAEAHGAAQVPNGHASSHDAGGADSAAQLMRMLKAGGANADATSAAARAGSSDEEKGKLVARSVALADRKGELALSSCDKMDRSEFRAVVQRMLTDKRLFESVYASYVAAAGK